MSITAAQVKELRERTGAGMMDCKNALVETGGDMDKAIDYLRKKGLATAAKKAGRATKEGLVGSYIHAGGKIGVLVEVACETDFVARTDDFQELVRDIAMHIAAADPQYVRREEVPESVIERERSVYKEQAKDSGKPDHILDRIIDGKMEKFYGQTALLEQEFVKDTDKTIEQLLGETVGKLGENIQVRRFARYRLGESTEGEESASEAASA